VRPRAAGPIHNAPEPAGKMIRLYLETVCFYLFFRKRIRDFDDDVMTVNFLRLQEIDAVNAIVIRKGK
jgi:hypothetical protein